MQPRRVIALLAVLGVVVLIVIAALTPLRADRIAELDAEAERIGRLWTQDQENDALAIESNEYFDRARDLEPPLTPPIALGGALLLGAVAVLAWPRRTPDIAPGADERRAHA